MYRFSQRDCADLLVARRVHEETRYLEEEKLCTSTRINISIGYTCTNVRLSYPLLNATRHQIRRDNRVDFLIAAWTITTPACNSCLNSREYFNDLSQRCARARRRYLRLNVSYVRLSMLNRCAMFTPGASFDRTNRIVIVPGGKIIGIWVSPKVSACACLLAYAMRHGKSRCEARRGGGGRGAVGRSVGLTETQRNFHDTGSIATDSCAVQIRWRLRDGNSLWLNCICRADNHRGYEREKKQI